MSRVLRSSVLVLAAAAALLLGACKAEVSIGEDTIPESKLESTVSTELGKKFDQPPPNIDCPGDLDAEVGASTTCTLTVDGESAAYDVAVEVTSIDEDTDKFNVDIKVADEPQGGSTDDTSTEPADGEDAPVDEGEGEPEDTLPEETVTTVAE